MTATNFMTFINQNRAMALYCTIARFYSDGLNLRQLRRLCGEGKRFYEDLKVVAVDLVSVFCGGGLGDVQVFQVGAGLQNLVA